MIASPRRGLLAVATAVCAVLALGSSASCAALTAGPTGSVGGSLGGNGSGSPSPGTKRVTVERGALHLDGAPWWPTGFDAYQLATKWSVNAGCGAETDLDAYFSSLPPRSLTRFDAFRSLVVDERTGGIDFSPVDDVVAAAERHGQLLIPVLTAQDGACEDEHYKQRSWYESGWRRPGEGGQGSFADWIGTAVDRWSASPSIAAWELAGEPETGVCADAGCAPERRTCPADSADVLRRWTDEAGAIVREHDRGALVTLGLLGGEQCGTAGQGYARVAASPALDVLQYHDYDDAAFLPRRLAETSKPLLVAELGIKAGSCLPLDERAARIGSRIDDYHRLGAAGVLVWNHVPDPRPSECTYDVGPGDPILGLPQMVPGP